MIGTVMIGTGGLPWLERPGIMAGLHLSQLKWFAAVPLPPLRDRIGAMPGLVADVLALTLLFILMPALPMMMPRAPALPPTAAAGAWVGTYECAGGMTGTTTASVRLRNGAIEAEIRFQAAASRPALPQGRVALRGAYNGTSRRLILWPEGGVARPGQPSPSASPLSAVAWIEPGSGTMEGRLLGAGHCSRFTAHQAEGATRL